MLEDFLKAKQLVQENISFKSLIMAAVRSGTSENIQKLMKSFPELVVETIARGNSLDGKIPEDIDSKET